MGKYRISRDRMVQEQLVAQGITDVNVLSAMRKVPRHSFVPEAFQGIAYADRPLPIGHNQTISQPYVVAKMSSLLMAQPGMSILEIGTGSGYQAAVLQAMGLRVHTVERIPELYTAVSSLFIQLRMLDIRLKLADGTLGWSEAAPYDRIIVTAGGHSVPEPLVDQLADPGIMIIPIGRSRQHQQLVRVIKENGAVRQEQLEPVAFVDLVGTHGW